MENQDLTTLETIALTENRYLGVAWKNGQVHSLCLASDPVAAHKLAESSLKAKPCHAEVFMNIDKLVKNLVYAV